MSRRNAFAVAGGAAASMLVPAKAQAEETFPVLRPGRPGEAGLDHAALDDLDEVIESRMGPDPDAAFPGAVLLVARHGIIAKHTAYGHAQTYRADVPLGQPRPMRPGTLFDVASCTKIIATTASVMALVDDGTVSLDVPAARWIPEVPDAVTVRRLLTHTAGLWEWQPTYLWAATGSDAVSYVTGLPLRYGVGDGRHYSDLGFMLLGEIVRRASGRSLPDHAHREVHRPLGMESTKFRPRRRGGVAATSLGNQTERQMIETGDPYPILGDRGVEDFDGWREHTLVGEVNDGNSAYAFNGEAGHAGLFATAHDIAVFAQTIANGGGYGHQRVFAGSTVDEFTSDAFHSGQGLGFWTHRFDDVPGLGGGGVGHSGFTGAEFAVDRGDGLVVVLLTNRLHPQLPAASVEPTWRTVREGVGKALSRAK
ncbi:CubicO group peptidase (beta-lactamase class C family) [Lipingzhangella halophila]|uniref:CubicO group peptidase (Beta-lactamase class C family) n=1 Tax=Lipingzhangella halophila TaxID=1783352 RepID=A0A7W7W292_9ACTN|nr:serine hydrolase [Lipingzhangella halophila]MBB4931168.1 CubicO group peptidase (beta-lactamase class C family) [Lipingzhangella halophila]